ncbi:hypothetical protein Tco_1054867 [Tanacetum coccineum]|uniref:Ribosomal protein S10 n=1 Tax=Tanacetum coccineum TaxID=301880 RepID=A0ABQ5GY02_9ASTR
MTRSTVKRLTKPLDEPEREFRRLRRAAMRSHQNESLAIAGRNLFDDEASSSNNTGAKLPTPAKTLHEHSRPNSSSFQNLIIFPTEKRGTPSTHVTSVDTKYMHMIFKIENEDPLLRYVKHYLDIVTTYKTSGATRDTYRLRFFHFSLKEKLQKWS